MASQRARAQGKSSFCNCTTMGKETRSFGMRMKKTHTLCVRCGRCSFHLHKSRCFAYAYLVAHNRTYNWIVKAIRRKTTGIGIVRYVCHVPCKFVTNFKEGTQAAPRKKAAIVSA